MTINEIIAELQLLAEHHGDDVLQAGYHDDMPLTVHAYFSHNKGRVIIEWSVNGQTILVCSTDKPR